MIASWFSRTDGGDLWMRLVVDLWMRLVVEIWAIGPEDFGSPAENILPKPVVYRDWLKIFDVLK